MFKTIFYALLIYILANCNSAFIKKEVKNEEKSTLIEDGISIKITGHYDPAKVTLKLKASLPDKNDYPEFNAFDISAEGKSEDGIIKLDIPAGKYYGILEIDNTKFYPLLFTNMSGINVFFGFYSGESTFLNLSPRAIYENRIKQCEYKEISSIVSSPRLTLNCGVLTIDPENKVFMEFKIEEESSFSSGGTAFIWLLASYISIMTESPAGVIIPVIMGPFALERKIDHNLK
ncbi:MAG TPA: hypothetical protein PLX69_02015 [Leptospiraceae bacterium]|nr:hypothetical protein [Leptospiraceae bacterium]HRG73312.1 hypothetical protein [Leptospiraceae bacterium]